MVLFEKLDHAAASALSRPGTGPAMDMLLPPRPMFARAAAMLAPFPLPKRPIRVNQVWLFKTSAGGSPTLPAAALEVLAGNSIEQLLAMVSDALPDNMDGKGTDRFPLQNLRQQCRNLRRLFLENPDLARTTLAHLSPGKCGPSSRQCGRLHALVSLLAGPDSMYVNFYGPPATIPTWSYADFLAGRVPEKVVRGAAVFVGTVRQNGSTRRMVFIRFFRGPTAWT